VFEAERGRWSASWEDGRARIAAQILNEWALNKHDVSADYDERDAASATGRGGERERVIRDRKGGRDEKEIEQRKRDKGGVEATEPKGTGIKERGQTPRHAMREEAQI
jgi:hypothetical protein